MRENRTSGSMSGSEKPSHGRAIEALPEETGSQRIGPAYHHGARVRLYQTWWRKPREMKGRCRVSTPDALLLVAAICAGWAVVSAVLITAALDRRGIKTPFPFRQHRRGLRRAGYAHGVRQARESAMPTTKANARVQRILAVPTAAYDQDWALQLEEWLPRAAFGGTDGTALPGPSGFDCVHVSVSEDEATGRTFTELVSRALDGGYGIVVTSEHGTAIEVSFGALATYRMFEDWRAPPGWNGGSVEQGREVLHRAESIVAGAPNEEYLPVFVRRALRRFLESAGVERPRVFLVVWPERSEHRDLVFSVERTAFATPEAYDAFMRSLSWFLPHGYQYLTWDSLRGARSAATPL